MDKTPPYTPTQDEKMTAMLAHLLQIFTWLMGPLVIYVAKRESRFVAFHALQAVLLQCAVVCGSVLWWIGWVVSLMLLLSGRINGHILRDHGEWFIRGMALGTFVWVGVMCLIMGLCALYSSKAYEGRWSEYPFVGRWARRWAGVAPQKGPDIPPNLSPQPPG